MPIKNSNHLILFLIFILLNSNNHNLLGTTPGVRASQANKNAEMAITNKNAAPFNVAMSDFFNISRVPGGPVAVAERRTKVVQNALNSIQSPDDAQFLLAILNQIVHFALEIEIRNAMIRAGLLQANPELENPEHAPLIRILEEARNVEEAIRNLAKDMYNR